MARIGLNSIASRIVLLLATVLLFAFGLGWFFQTMTVKERIYKAALDDLETKASAVSRLLDTQGFDAVKRDVSIWSEILDCRISIISADGRVVADSHADAATMENHRERPEVRTAFTAGSGADTRYSRSIHKEMLYAAKKPDALPLNAVVRVSTPSDPLRRILAAERISLFAAFALAGTLAIAGGILLARRLIAPLRHLAQMARRGSGISIPHTRFAPSVEILDLANALSLLEEKNSIMLRDLQEERTWLASILASLPVGVLVVNSKGGIRYANPPLGLLLRTEPQEGLPLQGVIRDPGLVEQLEAALRSTAGSCVISLRDRETRHLLAHTAPVSTGALAVVQDLTERYRLEEARRAFVADAGHELQTPLTVIRAAAEMLLEEEDSAQVHALAARIDEQGERMSGLVDDLLLLSRLESESALPIDLTGDVDLAETAALAIEEARSHPLAKQIDFERHLPEQAARTGWREGMLRAMRNLLDNAVKYTHERFQGEPGGEIVVTLTEENTAFHFSVSDNGVGIPEAQREVIFERFRRGDASRTRSGWGKGGYGLGLSIVKRVAELHGGEVRLAGSEEGTTFTLVLPRERGGE